VLGWGACDAGMAWHPVKTQVRAARGGDAAVREVEIRMTMRALHLQTVATCRRQRAWQAGGWEPAVCEGLLSPPWVVPQRRRKRAQALCPTARTPLLPNLKTQEGFEIPVRVGKTIVSRVERLGGEAL